MAVTVTPQSIEDKIAGVYYLNVGTALAAVNHTVISQRQEINPNHAVELGLVTICIIVLENGYKVEGTSACVDPNLYDEEKGRKAAYENAFEKIWQLEGYLLKESLHEAKQTQAQLADFSLDDCEDGACKI
ncbi:TPA: hypothetical protein MCM04_005106 [Klebsiella pneumoniae]|nr:hypothetical protein [Klebsiella pneumoniae]